MYVPPMYQTSLGMMHSECVWYGSVPNATDVPNVNIVPITILVYQKYLIYKLVYCTNRCTKRQVYQSAPNVPKLTRNDALILSLVYQNATGVPDVTTVTHTYRK